MVKIISGFCKFCNQEKSIEVNYIDASELNNKVFIKGRYKACENCTNSCELYSKAINEIR